MIRVKTSRRQTAWDLFIHLKKKKNAKYVAFIYLLTE